MFELRHRNENGVDLVVMQGRFTAADSGDASDWLKELMDNGANFVSVDMSELEFIDSSGLSVLVSSLNIARKNGGDLILFGVNERIMTLLKLTRLHETIDIFETEESALKSVS